MPQKFIIVSDSASMTSTARTKITQFLKSKSWGYWHWYQDVWLIAKVPDHITPTDLWKELDVLLPAGSDRIMIFKADDSGSRKGRAPPQSLPWLKKHWRRRD